MEELSYYRRNRHHYRRGGKYYSYRSVEETRPKIPLTIKRGNFILTFD